MSTAVVGAAGPWPAVALRDPATVMVPERLGAFHQTRLSFVRTLVRRMAREGWRVERERMDLDDAGYGAAVYRVDTPAGALRLVAFSEALDPADRTDRVIAERWDAAFALVAGEVDDERLARLRAEVPRQEAGRMSAGELVLSRANKSVRLFEHVVERLAAGEQPDPARVRAIGYLMRTTAVYGNGKFGVADLDRVRDQGIFALPFQAEMLTIYLIRHFSLDLVEHVAAMRRPDRAVRLDARVARALGVGNATGLGMAPFLVTHPKLIDRWIGARELALARVRAVDAAEPSRRRRFAELLDRAIGYCRQWHTDDERQGARIAVLTEELEALARRHAGGAGLDGAHPWDALIRDCAARSSLETQELAVALVLELYPERVDELERETASDEREETDPSMTVDALARLVDRDYAWALAVDFDAPRAQHHFWYVSEEKEEPRLGERRAEPGAELELRLDVAREVAGLRAAIDGLDAGERAGTVAAFLLAHPRWRWIVRRVQALAGCPYAEIRTNLLDESCLPLDLLRGKLATFGASKFDPKSGLWTRITLFQGAPLPAEIDRPDVDDWWLPVLP